LPEQRVVHYCGYFGGVNHQLFAYAACKFIQGTYASYCQIHRLLVTSVEAAEYMIYVFAGTYRVASGVDVERVIAPLGHPFEADETVGISLCFHLIIYGVCRIVTVYVDISCLLRMKLRGEQIVIHCSCACNAYEQNECQRSEKDSFFLLVHIILIVFELGKVSKILE